jgi:hypothetical protein
MKSRRDKQTLQLKKVLKKYSKVRTPSITDDFKGKIFVRNLRLYSVNWGTQVDIEFSGEFSAWSRGRRVKISKEELPKYSKIKVNKFLRKLIFPFIRSHLSYFGVELMGYHNIKKIIWV